MKLNFFGFIWLMLCAVDLLGMKPEAEVRNEVRNRENKSFTEQAKQVFQAPVDFVARQYDEAQKYVSKLAAQKTIKNSTNNIADSATGLLIGIGDTAQTVGKYLYHAPGEISHQIGGKRNILFNFDDSQNDYHETNPYIQDDQGKVLPEKVKSYEGDALLSPVTQSYPARVLYHTPGVISNQFGGPRNILYDRPPVQTGVQNITDRLTGKGSSNPFVKNTIRGDNGYQEKSLWTNLSSSAQDVSSQVSQELGDVTNVPDSRSNISNNGKRIPDASYLNMARALAGQSAGTNASQSKSTASVRPRTTKVNKATQTEVRPTANKSTQTDSSSWWPFSW